MKDLLSLYDVSTGDMHQMIDAAIDIKRNPEKYSEALKGKTLLMLFEKPSLRTRVSFETGMTQLGGHAIFYDISTSPLGKGKETVEDTGKVLMRYVDIIMARMKRFSDIKALADSADIPVMDALSELNHPCQILCDLQTMKEKKGNLKGLTLAYFGDCENNVTYSLMHGCAHMGMNIRVCCPDDEKFRPKQEIVEQAEEIAARTGGSVTITPDVDEAARDADVVYTDSWMSYHIDPAKADERKKKLMPYQVNSKILAMTNNALFMNCLPAQRDFEQSAEVLDSPRSIVFDQAENRLHAQKAIMLKLLNRL